jgi:hypothetical protein
MENLLELPPVEMPGDASPSIQPNFSDPDKFDWRSDDSIILRFQPATAVYRDSCNAVVIRQEGAGYEDDQYVVLRDAEAVGRIVAALHDEVRGSSDG